MEETFDVLSDIVGDDQMNMLTMPIPIEFGAMVLNEMVACNSSAKMTAIAYWSFLMNFNLQLSQQTKPNQVQ